jgi:2-dehydropantoate 2-reductase
MKSVTGVPASVGGSTWQSLQRGTGNIETDYLNGEIAMIAHRAGMAAPINERLAILARRAAAAGAKPGEMSAEQLAALLPR